MEQLSTGAGNENFTTVGLPSTIAGGAGNDTFVVTALQTSSTIHGGDGNDLSPSRLSVGWFRRVDLGKTL